MKKSFWERRRFFEVYSPVPGRTFYTSGHHLFSFRQITSMEYYARRSTVAGVTLQIHRDAIARRRRAVAQGIQLARSQRPEDHRL